MKVPQEGQNKINSRNKKQVSQTSNLAKTNKKAYYINKLHQESSWCLQDHGMKRMKENIEMLLAETKTIDHMEKKSKGENIRKLP